MVQVSNALGMHQPLLDSGMQVFRLASGHNFIQGRRTKSVAAVALYVACRCQQQHKNQHMLIDFADVLQVTLSPPIQCKLLLMIHAVEHFSSRSNLQRPN